MTPTNYTFARITTFAVFLAIGAVCGTLFSSSQGGGSKRWLERTQSINEGGDAGNGPSERKPLIGGNSPRIEEYGLTREVPIRLLNAGFVLLLGSDYSLNEEAKALFHVTPEEEQAISTAVRDVVSGVQRLMLDKMEVVEGIEGRFEISIPPVNERVAELKEQFDDRLVASLGYPRAKLLRLMLARHLNGLTANFGSKPQRVIIEKTDMHISFVRNVMDSETSESYSTGTRTRWSLEEDAMVQSSPGNSVGMAFVRPFLERVGVWPAQ